MVVKLLTLNVEEDRHYERWVPFVNKAKAEGEAFDVLCLQEVIEEDLLSLAWELDMGFVYEPMITIAGRNSGVAIFSTSQLENTEKHYYNGQPDILPVRQLGDDYQKNEMILVADVTVGGKTYTVATNHFTWINYSELHKTKKYQDQNWPELTKVISALPEFVMGADLNIDRKTSDHYPKLKKLVTDHIPEEVTNSIDHEYHRAGNSISFMVDYIVTKGEQYEVNSVTQHFGLSDHSGFSCVVTKNSQ